MIYENYTKLTFQRALIKFDWNIATLISLYIAYGYDGRAEWATIWPTKLTIFTYYLALYKKKFAISALSPRYPELLCAIPTCKLQRIFKAFQAKPKSFSLNN